MHDNLLFFNGGANEAERTHYRYSQKTSTPNKMLRVAYMAPGLQNEDAKTALRISPQSTTPQEKKKRS